MQLVSFFVPTLLGFYLIFKSIKSIDKIDKIKSNGITTKAEVVKLREDITPSTFDEDGFDSTKYEYYYTIKFTDKKGNLIEKEIEFSKHKKPKNKIPFTIDIIYYTEKNKTEIIFKNSKRNILEFLTLLFLESSYLYLSI